MGLFFWKDNEKIDAFADGFGDDPFDGLLDAALELMLARGYPATTRLRSHWLKIYSATCNLT